MRNENVKVKMEKHMWKEQMWNRRKVDKASKQVGDHVADGSALYKSQSSSTDEGRKGRHFLINEPRLLKMLPELEKRGVKNCTNGRLKQEDGRNKKLSGITIWVDKTLSGCKVDKTLSGCKARGVSLLIAICHSQRQYLELTLATTCCAHSLKQP